MLLYAKGPNGRKNKYSLLTTIEKDDTDGRMWVYKKTLRPQASVHIAAILDNYTRLAPLLDGKLILPEPEHINGNELRMPFIHGDNLDQVLYRLLRDRSEDKIIDLFSELLELIEATGTRKVDPSRNATYQKLLGNHYKGLMDCSSLGLIDLNLDNFIQTKDARYLVDYEWYFTFPIPVHYLFGRLLYYSFSLKFDKLMRSYANPNHPVIYLSPTFLVPQKVYEHFKPFFNNRQKLLASENAFQAFVSIYSKPISIDAKSFEYKLITEPERPFIDDLHLRNIGLEAENKELRVIAEGFRKDILGLGDELEVLRQQNARLNNLKLVKLINKLQRQLKRK